MNNKLQVLLVEDNPGDADLIEEMLPPTGDLGFAVHCVRSLSDAVNFLDNEKVDLTLLDLDLSDSDGMDSIRIVRNAAPSIPIVVIAGNDDEQIGITAVKGGAQDYLLKGKTPPDYLCRVLRHAVERQQTEEKLRESERIMRLTLNALPTHIAIIDSTGNIIASNNAWEDFTATFSAKTIDCQRRTETLNDYSRPFGNTTLDPAFAAGIRSVLNNVKDHFEMEYVCQCPSGKRWFYGQVMPFPDKNSGWAVVACEDITARRADEQEKVRLASQLRHTQKMDAIGTLAGGIAHDFNNILSAVLGFTELCLSDVEKGSQLEKNMREIYIAGNRAKDLIKQMLTFAGKDDEKIKPIQVGDIAREVLKLIRPIFPPSIEIQHHIDSDAFVLSNPIQLQQVFMNLCTNALKTMDANRGKLSIRIAEKQLDPDSAEMSGNLQPGKYLTIEVEDTGEGISRDKIDRIFEPYFCAQGNSEGSGLGLAMVHSIVKKCKGNVCVNSEIGSGTSFLIHLPIFEPTAPKKTGATRKLPGGKERILFVDDELAIVNMNKQALQKLGYQVASYCCSLDALKAVEANPNDFDLVITDMTMPEMTGEQLAEAIIKINPKLPIILCTGYSRTVIESNVVEMGIKAVMMKPIPIRQMASKIRSILDDAGQV